MYATIDNRRPRAHARDEMRDQKSEDARLRYYSSFDHDVLPFGPSNLCKAVSDRVEPGLIEKPCFRSLEEVKRKATKSAGRSRKSRRPKVMLVDDIATMLLTIIDNYKNRDIVIQN